ncbi:heavy metal sensor histidine kinase [Cupriavidus pinatubonensis]|nr:heavy metal sensor histidine kinase [Cupriavidus pinatubonensis]
MSQGSSVMPLSLTGRLALFFALVVSIALASMGAFAYYSLAVQLESRDNEVIRGKLEQVEHFLREVEGIDDVPAAQHRFDDMVRGYADLIVRVSARDGRLLFSTSDGAPRDFGQPRRDAGDSFMGLIRSADAVLGKDGTRVIVVIGATGEDRREVTGRFRTTLLLGTTIGVVLTAMAGAAITRRELQPTHALIKQTNRISVERLSYRVEIPFKPTEVQDIARAFNEMLQRLEDGYVKLSRFSADLAHDLRTPLNNLIGHAEVALSRDRTPSEYVVLIEESLLEYQRLARMIDAMLFLARADSAKVTLDVSTISLHRELKKLSAYFEMLAEERGIAIAVNGDATLEVDSILFQRAIHNLLSNAVRHARSGTTIKIAVVKEEAGCLIEVANWGDTIPEEDLAFIFERFYRGDAARSNSSQSTGLGLSIVRSIMDLHGGRAEVVSEPNGATRFRLWFPTTRPNNLALG